MSIPDTALPQWWRLCLDRPMPGSTRWSRSSRARGIVERYHGDEAAREAEAHFSRVVRRGEAPDVPTAALPAGDDPPPQ